MFYFNAKFNVKIHLKRKPPQPAMYFSSPPPPPPPSSSGNSQGWLLRVRCRQPACHPAELSMAADQGTLLCKHLCQHECRTRAWLPGAKENQPGQGSGEDTAGEQAQHGRRHQQNLQVNPQTNKLKRLGFTFSSFKQVTH